MLETRLVPYSAVFFLYACSNSTAAPPPGGGDAGSGTSSTVSSAGTSSSGSGGSGSSSGGSSSGPTGTGSDGGAAGDSSADGAAPDCSGVALFDGFESDTAGSPPSASIWSVSGLAGCSGIGNPGATAIYSIVVDSSQAHSGNQSVKVVGGDPCGPMMTNLTAFAQLSGGEVYGRFYTRFASATPYHHTAFMLLGLQADAGPLGEDATGYLQMAAEEGPGPDGGTGGMLVWNYNDTTLPPNGNSAGFLTTTYPIADVWTQIDFHTSASTSAVEVSVNGTALSGMTFVPGTTPASNLNSNWASGHPPLSFQSISFGWADFNAEAQMTLWFDDVALSATPIPASCD